jgi:hypothetical protein
MTRGRVAAFTDRSSYAAAVNDEQWAACSTTPGSVLAGAGHGCRSIVDPIGALGRHGSTGPRARAVVAFAERPPETPVSDTMTDSDPD